MRKLISRITVPSFGQAARADAQAQGSPNIGLVHEFDAVAGEDKIVEVDPGYGRPLTKLTVSGENFSVWPWGFWAAQSLTGRMAHWQPFCTKEQIDANISRRSFQATYMQPHPVNK